MKPDQIRARAPFSSTRSTRPVTREILFSDDTPEGVLVLVTLDVENRCVTFKEKGVSSRRAVTMSLARLWEHAVRIRDGSLNVSDLSGACEASEPTPAPRPGIRETLRRWLRREGAL